MLRAAFVILAAVTACAGGPPPPALLDTRHDSCAWCRMTVSQPRFAAQLAAPGEEPRFFDDLGCLRSYLRSTRELPRGTVVYVADHRTGAWVAASTAVYSHCPELATPMASGLVAHADAASRATDGAARGCTEVPGTQLVPLAAAEGAQ